MFAVSACVHMGNRARALACVYFFYFYMCVCVCLCVCLPCLSIFLVTHFAS